MSMRSRIVILVAALALGLVYVLPIWRISLEAPQYPEGLGMVIRIDDIVGQKPHDLANINNLNHYIGMKRIVPDAIPELRVMPWVVAGLMALGLLTAALGRRPLLYGWVGVFLLVSVAGLVDFWQWEYDYGHDLDEETAIIKVPGMSYQPPLIGSRQILNFKANSWPGAGGWTAILAALAGVGVAASELRRSRVEARGADGRPGAGALALLVASASLVQGCGPPSPRPLAYGEEVCAHCHMTLVQPAFGAEIVTETGKVVVFDAVECLVGFLDGGAGEATPRSAWVVDFAHPGELVRAADASFLVSPSLHSPMGAGIAAFAAVEDRDEARATFGGEAMGWEELLGAAGRGSPGVTTGRIEAPVGHVHAAPGV